MRDKMYKKIIITIVMLLMLVSSVFALEINRVSMNNNVVKSNIKYQTKNLELNKPSVSHDNDLGLNPSFSLDKKYEVHPSIGINVKKIEPHYDIGFKDNTMKTDWDAPELEIIVPDTVIAGIEFDIEVVASDDFGVARIIVKDDFETKFIDCNEQLECNKIISWKFDLPGKYPLKVFAEDISGNKMLNGAFFDVQESDFPDLSIEDFMIIRNGLDPFVIGDNIHGVLTIRNDYATVYDNFDVVFAANRGSTMRLLHQIQVPIHLEENGFNPGETIEVPFTLSTINNGDLVNNDLNLNVVIDSNDEIQEVDEINNVLSDYMIHFSESQCDDTLFIEDTLNLAETKTYTIDGTDYEIKLDEVTTYHATFIINGEIAHLSLDKDYGLNDGSKISLINPSPGQYASFKLWSRPCDDFLPDLVLSEVIAGSWSIEGHTTVDNYFGIDLWVRNDGMDDVSDNVNVEFEIKNKNGETIAQDYNLVGMDIAQGDFIHHEAYPFALDKGEYELITRVNKNLINSGYIPLEEMDFTNNEITIPLTVVTEEEFCILRTQLVEDQYTKILQELVEARQSGDEDQIDDVMDDLEDFEDELDYSYEQCGLTAPNFQNYPNFLFENHEFDAALVLGDGAPAADMLSLTEIASGIQDFIDDNGYQGIHIGSLKLASEVDKTAQDIITVGDACTNELIREMFVDITGEEPENCNDPFIINENETALFLITGLYGKNQVWLNGNDDIVRRFGSKILARFDENQHILSDRRYIEYDTDSYTVPVSIWGVAKLEDSDNPSDWEGIQIELRQTNGGSLGATTITNEKGEYSFDIDLEADKDYAVYARKINYAFDKNVFHIDRYDTPHEYEIRDLVLNTEKRMIFNYVYQPDGSRDFSDQENLPHGTAKLDSYTMNSAQSFDFEERRVIMNEIGDLDFKDSYNSPFYLTPQSISDEGATMEDLGEGFLTHITQAPTEPADYKIPAQAGHIYAIKTKAGKYALIQIMSIREANYDVDLEILSAEPYPNPVQMNTDWGYLYTIRNNGDSFVKAKIMSMLEYGHEDNQITRGLRSGSHIIDLQPGEETVIGVEVDQELEDGPGTYGAEITIDGCNNHDGFCIDPYLSEDGHLMMDKVDESNEENNLLYTTFEVIEQQPTPVPVHVHGKVVLQDQDKIDPSMLEGIEVVLPESYFLNGNQITHTNANGEYEFYAEAYPDQTFLASVKSDRMSTHSYDQRSMYIDIESSEETQSFEMPDLFLHNNKKLIANWVYQPDGSTDFSDQENLPKGRVLLNSMGDIRAFTFDTEQYQKSNIGCDILFSDSRLNTLKLVTCADWHGEPDDEKQPAIKDLGLMKLWGVDGLEELEPKYEGLNAESGHVYQVRTHDGKYALVQILSLAETNYDVDLQVTATVNPNPINGDEVYESKVITKNIGDGFIKAYLPVCNKIYSEEDNLSNLSWLINIDLEPGESEGTAVIRHSTTPLEPGMYYFHYNIDNCEEWESMYGYNFNDAVEEIENNNDFSMMVEAI